MLQKKIFIILTALLFISISLIYSQDNDYSIIRKIVQKKEKNRIFHVDTGKVLETVKLKEIKDKIEKENKLKKLNATIKFYQNRNKFNEKKPYAEYIKEKKKTGDLRMIKSTPDKKKEKSAKLKKTPSKRYALKKTIKDSKDIYWEIDYKLQRLGNYKLGPNWKKWVEQIERRIEKLGNNNFKDDDVDNMMLKESLIESLRSFLTSILMYMELRDSYLLVDINNDKENTLKVIKELEKLYNNKG